MNYLGSNISETRYVRQPSFRATSRPYEPSRAYGARRGGSSSTYRSY